jgi:uncharacterized membrane protein
VRGDFQERRYSDDELRRIIEDATRSELQPKEIARQQEGVTLAEIREIAREVGIDPHAVDRAAASLLATESIDAAPSSRAFSRVLHEETIIPRALTDSEMRLVAMQAERVLGRRGSLYSAGDLVEWRDGRDRLYVGIVRGEQRTRVRVIADQTSELFAGSAAIGGLGLILVPTVAGPGVATIPGLVLLAAAVYGVIRLFWKQRRNQARKELEELLEILVDAV